MQRGPGSQTSILPQRLETSTGKYLRAGVGSYFHPVGTCAMGEGAEAVVDSELRVHGISALRVVDASVMPSLLSNNTIATAYCIAERGAELIRQGSVAQVAR